MSQPAALTEAVDQGLARIAARPGLLAALSNRFRPTRHVTRIDRSLRPDLLPDWAEGLSDLDRPLFLRERRATPASRLWMERR